MHEATGTLEERIKELKEAEAALTRQIEEIGAMQRVIESALGEALLTKNSESEALAA